MSHEKRTLVFVVNGEDAELSLPVICKLRGAKRFALRMTKNTGRPVEDWSVYDHRGKRLDETVAIGDLLERQRLFAAVQIGAGGDLDRSNHRNAVRVDGQMLNAMILFGLLSSLKAPRKNEGTRICTECEKPPRGSLICGVCEDCVDRMDCS